MPSLEEWGDLHSYEREALLDAGLFLRLEERENLFHGLSGLCEHKEQVKFFQETLDQIQKAKDALLRKSVTRETQEENIRRFFGK